MNGSEQIIAFPGSAWERAAKRLCLPKIHAGAAEPRGNSFTGGAPE